MNPGSHPNPFASILRRLHAKASIPVASQTRYGPSKQHPTRQHFQPEDSRGPFSRTGSCCPARRSVLFSVGLFAFALAAIPAQAFAGWVVEGEPDVLVGYGEGYVSELGTRATHHGVDCLASAGAQCLFPTGGTVSFVGSVPAGDSPGCGTTLAVSVRIEDGRTLTLMPFDEVMVTEGQHVVEGQNVGMVASAGDGSTTLPHVHVGLKRGRTYYDPSELLGIAPASSAGEGEADYTAEPVPVMTREQAPPATEASADGSIAVPVLEERQSKAPVEQAQYVQAQPAVYAATPEALSSETRSREVNRESAAKGPTVSSTVSDYISPYEAWLAVGKEGVSGEETPFISKLPGDITALVRSTGLPPVGAGMLALSFLGIVALITRIYCGKETDRVVEKKMKHRSPRAESRRCGANSRYRLATFGRLTTARQGK